MARRLAVVGAGYWGTAVALLAKEAGWNVALLDDENPLGASINSAGIFMRWWYKAETSAGKVPASWSEWYKGPSMAWLEERGLVTETGEDFSTWRNLEPRFRNDCWLVIPNDVLRLARHRKIKVLHLDWRVDRWLIDTVEGIGEADCVVVAAGAWTDELLVASGLPPVGVKPLRGRAAAYPGFIERPKTYLVKPYSHYTVRPWGGSIRLGDSVEQTVVRLGDSAERKAADGLPAAFLSARDHLLWPGALPVATYDGLRPVTPQYVVEQIRPGLVIATGGHRVGLGLAEPVARRALALLGAP